MRLPKLSGDGGMWTKDGTFSGSGVSSISYSLTDNWDRIMIVFDGVTGSSSNVEDLKMTVNGVTTASYHIQHNDGTTTTGNGYWIITSGKANSFDGSGPIYVDGRFNHRPNLQIPGTLCWEAERGGVMAAADVTSPINSFSLSWTTGNITASGTVYGTND